jgi:CubicO group peptidase (beta-lactamase class C family)
MLGFVPAFALLAAPPSSPDEAMADRLEATLSKLVKEDRFSGTVVVLREGRPVFARAYGLADRALNVRNSLRTKYRFHSISKWFTGVYLSQLMDAGRLSASDRVSKFLPEWPKALDSITVGHLLTHTSGLPWSTNDWANRYRISPTATALALIKEVPVPVPVDAPKPWAYNNVNFEIAAAVAEAASGSEFAASLKQGVLDRAGLRNTVLALPVAPEPYAGDRLVADLATGYNGAPGKPVDTVCYSSAIPASGGLVGTVADLAAFGQAFMSGRLLSPAGFRRMTEGVETGGKNRYGYGVVVGVKDGHRFFRHDGGNNGGIAWLEVFPDDHVVIAAASNLGYADARALSRLSEDVFPPKKTTLDATHPRGYNP